MKNLKKLFTALLLLCATAASAHDFEVDGIYYNVTDEANKTVEVTYKGSDPTEFRNEYSGDVVIPETVTYNDVTYSVTTIGDRAFYDCGALRSITIPNSVTTIGGGAFYDCPLLTSVTIGSGVTIIGNDAFRNCTGLTSITIPNSVTSIGDFAFYGCTRLTSIEIPNSVTSIGERVFESCSGLTSIVVDSDNSVYDSRENCNAIIETATNTLIASCKNTVIPSSVTTIGEYAFYGCSWLTSIEIPNSVTTIGGGAFEDCTGLTSIEIPNSVTTIGSKAFYKCTGLTSVTIGNSVTSIGDFAFYKCDGLTSIVIPNSVTSIGKSAFDGCTGLTSVTIGNSVTSIGLRAFTGCIGLTSIVIPNSVTSIGDYAFCGCDGLTSIIIPNSVTSIGESAFMSCDGLTSVTIGNSVTSIGSYAFSYCTGLTNVTIGNSVTSIGDWAFYDCTGLTSITIPNSVTSIGDDAFRDCYGLTNVTIGNSVTSIGIFAFYECDGLTSITSLIPAENLFVPGSSAFYRVDKANCTLYVPKGAKETYAATDRWKDFENIVELDSEETTEVEITVGQYGCTTFCSPYALDFSEVEGLKAYSAVGYNTDTQIVTLVRVMTTADGMGLFIKGEPGTYIVPVVETTGEHTLNLLVGTLESTNIDETTGAMTNYKFTIKSGDSEPKFYKFANSSTLNAGKAYLQLPTAWVPSEAQSSIGIRFDEGEATGVDEINGEQQGDCEAVYDLSGRRVENPASGIYIIGGKKVLVK